MAGRKRGDLPSSLVRGQERFEAWRRMRQVGARIPGKLWTLAEKLAVAYGVSRTASVLKLDYHALKNRVDAKNSDCTSASGSFVALSSPLPTAATECVIEFEDGLGARMRVCLRGGDAPDLVALGRMFRSGE